MPAHDPKNTRADGYRQVYANSYNFQFNGNDLVMNFGILHDLGKPKDGMEQQVSVIVNQVGLKTLALFLSGIVRGFETSTGTTIPVPPDTQTILDKMQADAAIAQAQRAVKS